MAESEPRVYLAQHCEVMASLIEQHAPRTLEPQPPEHYFEELVSTIIGQQLSVKAAATINARFRAAVADPTSRMVPGEVLKLSVDDMRAHGLSGSKATYIRGIAEAFDSGTIDPVALSVMDDTEVMATLTLLKGVGPWTAEMFLMFAMGRPDVWSVGDLGLRKSVSALFGEDADLSAVSERWRPYRSYASLYLWAYSEATPVL